MPVLPGPAGTSTSVFHISHSFIFEELGFRINLGKHIEQKCNVSVDKTCKVSRQILLVDVAVNIPTQTVENFFRDGFFQLIDGKGLAFLQ